MARRGAGRRRSRQPTRLTHRRLLVVCGGQVTEPQYFQGLRDFVGNRGVHVKVVIEDRSPHYIVKKAAESLKTDDFDQVWCVFDVDDFDCTAALTEARRRGVNIAMSHPCFDLWLLLHFEDCLTHVDGYQAIKPRLRRHIPDYGTSKSGKSVDFAMYRDRISHALRRAKDLDQNHERPHANPSTGVWRLVESIMEETRG
ncbi:RloB-like protein [Stackebrandtia endophytica]|uniref:RloB-like protein n=1 Tax=Stackebrandtia endophytica TaxID=1496996 RepID=A0A543B476_9ACTN|nr:RloB family protein [Stackebrandtia endophytica]TQL79628.1 RloB-like protein [Stackebrandtia endophytica]